MLRLFLDRCPAENRAVHTSHPAPFHHVHTPNTANPSPALPRPPSTIVVALLAGGGYAEATAAHRILSTGGHVGKVILTI